MMLSHFLPSMQPRSRLTTLAAAAAALFAASLTVSGSALAISDVVISQVYGAGGNTGTVYKNDFIELFNRGTTPISLNGWSVQYASAAGTSWQVTTLPNVTLQPGQYFLVQEAAGTAGTTSLPTADKVGTIAMSASAGKVVLANIATAVSSATAPAVQDLVGYGATATPFEGSGPAAVATSLNAATRIDSGCTDTDQNKSDFFSNGAAAPRNSASPLHLCQEVTNPPIVTACPSSLNLLPGSGGSTLLSASDTDGRVNSISLDSNTNAAITLGTLTPAANIGDSASITLHVASSLASGNYPVTVNFGNDQSQNASCVVNVSVQAAPGVTHTIPQIQGGAQTSAYVNTNQITEGVVTLKLATGFFMQDPQGDGDPSTSDGIFVYTSTAPSVNVGEKVRVAAKVVEFTAGDATRPITQLNTVTSINVISTDNSVTPANLSLPLSSTTEWERYEGMLVRFTNSLTVAQNYFLGRYGQLSLSAGRLEAPTNRYRPGTPEAQALAASNAANLIILDDGSSAQNPNPMPYIGQDNTVRAGDTATDVTGVVDFGLLTSSPTGPTGYKLQPTVTPTFSRSNPRTNAPESVGGNVKVASFNVLNFFTTFTNGQTADGQTGQGCTIGGASAASNCRGANNLAEFVRQRAKIVTAMKAIDADVFGLMEMQNNGEVAISNLVNGLNAELGSVTYAAVPVPLSISGDDAIRVAMIYKPAKLSLVGNAVTDTDAINNRPPLAQTFALTNGKRFSVVVNHLKSKGSCPTDNSTNTDQGDGQGCWNTLRTQQAQRLVNAFIPQVKALAQDTDVLTIGDFNAMGAEDPTIAMINGGMVSEIERFVRPHGTPYSFIFDSFSGYLDHAFSSASLSSKVTNVAEWHINADEPSSIDYNTEFRTQDLYSVNPFRSSDHDPVIIGLNLQPLPVDVSTQVSAVSSGLVYNRSTQLYTGTITLKNTGTSSLNGPINMELTGLSAGVTLTNATGSYNGVPYIKTTANTLAAGQSITVAISLRNPNKVSVSYVVKTLTGNL